MITINGKTYEGNSVVVMNDEVIIDGKRVDDKDLPQSILRVEVKGQLASLSTDRSVSCEDVNGPVNAGGSVQCDNIVGEVKAKGSVNCDDIEGDVTAGGSVNCDDVTGNVYAKGSINKS